MMATKPDNRAQWRKNLGDFMEGHLMHWAVGILVVVNALILGLETFQDPAELMDSWLYKLDDAIVMLFVIEIGLKVVALGPRFFRDGWHIFDFMVVAVSVLPLDKGLAAIRSLRVLRLMTLIEFSPKLRHILRGLWHSVPGVLNVSFILVLLFYVSSVMAVYFFRAEGVVGFSDLGQSMMSMFQVLTGDDWSNILRRIQVVFPYAWIFFYAYYIIIVFIILNLFIGVVVNALQAAEEELFSEGKEDDLAGIREELKIIRKEIATISKATKPQIKRDPNKK